MLWFTRQGVHLDRVATPWLLKRFVDPAAEFAFIDPANESGPADGIPFGLPGCELSPYDEHGSTFRKVVRKYQLSDGALPFLASIVESGIAVATQLPSAAQALARYPEGAGLNALSEGMLFSGLSDHEILARSAEMYDAVHVYCRAKVYESELPPEVLSSPAKRFAALTKLLSPTLN
jgi:hypothetical protein